VSVIAGVERAFLVLALDTAVDQLTCGESVRIDLDGGETATAGLASLLVQLEDAVYDNLRAASSSGGPGSKPPLWLDPLALFSDIDAVVSACQRVDTVTRSSRVRAWAGAMHGQTEGVLADAVTLAERWVVVARGLLDPKPPIPLRGWVCPQCGWGFTEQLDDFGERVRRPTLEVNRTTGAARCLSEECGARWDFGQLDTLIDAARQQSEAQQWAE